MRKSVVEFLWGQLQTFCLRDEQSHERQERKTTAILSPGLLHFSKLQKQQVSTALCSWKETASNRCDEYRMYKSFACFSFHVSYLFCRNLKYLKLGVEDVQTPLLWKISLFMPGRGVASWPRLVMGDGLHCFIGATILFWCLGMSLSGILVESFLGMPWNASFPMCLVEKIFIDAVQGCQQRKDSGRFGSVSKALEERANLQWMARTASALFLLKPPTSKHIGKHACPR